MRKPSRPDDVRKQNVRLVLSCLRQNAPLSRTEIATQSQLSPASVTSITSAMCDAELTMETTAAPLQAVGRGRPQVQLSLQPHAAAIAAMSLRNNHFQIALYDYSKTLLWEYDKRLTTLSLSLEQFESAVFFMLEKAAAAAQRFSLDLKSVGVAVQGVVDIKGRDILWSPATGLQNIPLAKAIEDRFGLHVMVSNDTAMIARGLAHAHVDILGENFLVLQVSRGIGMSLVKNGKPVGGLRSSANEFGHMTFIEDGALCRCGQRGCIEAYSSNYAILRHADGMPMESIPPAKVDPALIAQKLAIARAQEGPERDAFQRAGQAIGFGLRNLFALVDPMPIALVGSGAAAFDITEPYIFDALAKSSTIAKPPSISCFEDDEAYKKSGSAIAALDLMDDVFALAIAEDRSFSAKVPSPLMEPTNV